ncbi:unnamed protein product [Chondrus crispus]|uniref:Integrase catalytic domain-containing protein n=1 Tax=Chondrus crispus TaxID=2769 RepID=R7QFB9_CHOCR|nr:unnamed protein product [Chondrus crispus]CDF36784.1 unnamed protein product [Chondrus crispus]|eukprot:XP_005716603.1 unnamed protein product [Chondrus crispus]
MPLGLTNAPATFQRAMDILLSPFRWKCCLVYIIIFSKSWEEHVVHVDEILSVLEKACVKLKLRKCEFFVEKIKYLGRVVRPGTLEVDAARTAALEQVRYPQTQTQLRSFLGLCNVYRRFVPHYAKIEHPLNQLLKKGQLLQLEGLDEPCEKDFHKLKDAILEPPVLALPKKDLPYSVDTDASDYQIGAALFQTHPDAQRKPIRFFSRTLAAAERNYSVSEKECLAVIWAVQTLGPYLYGEHFVVHTDYASLRQLMNVTDPSGRLIRWRLRLSEFDFEIKYKKGKANSQADALSRLRTAEETLIREQAVDPFCNRIKEEMDAGKVRTFSMETEEFEGTLCRTAAEFAQVVIPQSLRDRVLSLSHYAKLAGRPGGRKLYKTLRRYFYWPTMALDCYAVAKNCAACARERVKLRRNTKEMKLFTPKAPLEFVAIDILGEQITRKRGNRYILVISDRYSKLVRTVPLKKISAAYIAQAFVHHLVFVYGPPVKLLSDNGTQFTARFFQNVCRILGICNVFTTTYHPQSNGQVERFNRTLTSALRKYVGEHPKDWDLFSDAVTFAYNTQVHRTTNIAPFELVLARAPRSIALQAQPSLEGFSSNRAYYLKWQSWLESLIKGAGKSLRKEQARYKRNFDARLRKSKYDIPSGSYVFLRKEQGTATEPKHKLAQVATGPYQVKESTENTVVIAIGDQEERVSRDRVELAPSPMGYTPIVRLRQALQFLNREGEREEPAAQAKDRTDDGPLINQEAAGISPDLQEMGGSEEQDEDESLALRKGDGELDTQEEGAGSQEYVIDKIVDHGYDGEKLILKVRWYGYTLKDATWEPIE